MLCIAVIPVRHWILIFQSYFLQQFWPEAVLIVSLQLICQGQISLLAFHVAFHKEFMEAQTPKNTCGLWGGQPRWCVFVAGNKCTDFSIQELWNLIQMNKKWKNETTQRELLWQDVCCPGSTWQEELQGRIWVHWPNAGDLDSLIPLPDSCQEQFNARTLNLPTLWMYLLDLINGQRNLSPLV